MITSSTDHLKVEVLDRVLVLTMNRPDRLNALSREMIEAGIQCLRAAIEDRDIGAVMLIGEGRAFCAGGDVSAMAGGDDGPPPSVVRTTPSGAKASGAEDGASSYEDSLDRQRRGHELSWLLYSMPKVTIAAVNGHAVGAGLGIAMSCDLRLASENAKFGTAFAKVGFGGDYGTSWQLTRLVGQAKAKELFFLGDILGAEEAMRIGLANRKLAADGFKSEALSIAKRIASGPLVSFRYMKENVNLSLTQDFRTILDREAMTHLRCGQTSDHQEGVRAFMEKREPVFQGR
jgi:2-(1,2-epoxy-1,2-dihydrophenyl)acetyl-CoA isomerase